MSGWNLPPGCSVNGNSAEDARLEAIYEAIDEILGKCGRSTDEDRETASEAIYKLFEKAYEDGYQAASQDAARAAVDKQIEEAQS